MHIALVGLPRLADPPDAARRIMIADMLLAAGVRPREIFAALEFDATSLDSLEKFNPEEPRNPKGSGRISGEWAREIEAAEADAEAVVEDASRVAARIGPAAARVVGLHPGWLPLVRLSRRFRPLSSGASCFWEQWSSRLRRAERPAKGQCKDIPNFDTRGTQMLPSFAFFGNRTVARSSVRFSGLMVPCASDRNALGAYATVSRRSLSVGW
jgi:hypothetical protein